MVVPQLLNNYIILLPTKIYSFKLETLFRKKIEYKFKDSGYERHLIDMLEKEILVQNPNIKWSDIAGQF